jgi:CO/xanthine dehydrogenase Mo-binding subunit
MEHLQLKARKGRKIEYDNSHFHGCGNALGVRYFKVGFMDDGKITAVQINSVYGSVETTNFVDGTSIPNIKIVHKEPYLNRGPRETFKHGKSKTLAISVVFDHVAAELGIDPIDVWLANDGTKGKPMEWIDENVKAVQGFDSSRNSLKEVIATGKQAIDWDNKWHAPGAKQLPNGKYHGIGVTIQNGWDHSPWGTQMCAGVYQRGDGSVSILAQHSDVGINHETVYREVFADVMGMKLEDVVWDSHEDVGFNLRAAGGSAATTCNLNALVPVARAAKDNLLDLAVKPRPPMGVLGTNTRPAVFPGKGANELDIKDSVIFEKANPANKIAVKDFVKEYLDAWFAGQEGWQGGGPFMAWDYHRHFTTIEDWCMVRQGYFMEVEVDPDTGSCDIKNIVIVNDVGKVLSPDTCNGQQYGGAYMGLGRAKQEAVIYDPQTGIKLNDNLIGYPVAVMNDCSGTIDCHLLETGLAYGPFGMCGIGESAGGTVSSLTFSAIYNAIGKHVDDFPTSPHKILKALGKA